MIKILKIKVLAVHFRGKGMYNTPGHPFTPTPKQIFSKVDEYLKRDFDKISNSSAKLFGFI